MAHAHADQNTWEVNWLTKTLNNKLKKYTKEYVAVQLLNSHTNTINLSKHLHAH